MIIKCYRKKKISYGHSVFKPDRVSRRNYSAHAWNFSKTRKYRLLTGLFAIGACGALWKPVAVFLRAARG